MNDDGRTHWYYDEYGLGGKTACGRSPFSGLICTASPPMVTCPECRQAISKQHAAEPENVGR